jgi:hypothetical protein
MSERDSGKPGTPGQHPQILGHDPGAEGNLGAIGQQHEQVDHRHRAQQQLGNPGR